MGGRYSFEKGTNGSEGGKVGDEAELGRGDVEAEVFGDEC